MSRRDEDGSAANAATPDEVMFSRAVRAEQVRRGSRESYARQAAAGRFARELSADCAAFIAERDSVYLATANAEGQPYIQHRGGPKGFIHVLDDKTLAFADYRGNRQYITTGNLAGNDRAFLFLMDYAERRRIKIWGRARVVDDDPALLARLMPEGYRARPEQVLLFTVEAWESTAPSTSRASSTRPTSSRSSGACRPASPSSRRSWRRGRRPIEE